MTEKINPDDYTPKSIEGFDEHAIAESLREKERDILNRIHEGGYDNEELEEVDIDPTTKLTLKIINGLKIKEDDLAGEDHNSIVQRLLEYDEKQLLIESLSHFQNLNSEIAARLIKEKNSNDVLENLDSFKKEDHLKIIMMALETEDDYYDAIAHLWKLENVDYAEVLEKLIEMKNLSAIFYLLEEYGHMDKLKNLDQNKLVLSLIKNVDPYEIYSNIGRFHDLNKAVFQKLLVLHEELFGWLIQGLEEGVFTDLDASDYNDLALKIAEDDFEGVENLADALEHFYYLNKEVARLLIKNGYANKISRHRGAFDSSVDLDELLEKAA